MIDLGEARRTVETEDEYFLLACDAIQMDECIILMSDRYPDKRDANHVASIDLRRGTDPEEFVVRMETIFRRANRQHCRFDVDFRTNPQEIERVLRKRGYVPYGAVAQVYRGCERSDAPRPARVPVRIEEIRDEAGFEKWRPLSYESHGGVHDPSGYPRHAAEFDVERVKAAWQEGKDLRVYLASIGDEPEAAGCCQLYRHKGAGMIEGVFVHEQKRGYGVASSLIRHVVARSRAAGDDLTFLFANSIDTPRYMYERLGFQDLMETTEWLKVWADTGVSEDSLVFD